MYCLSQFCCFCFRNNVKLKLLHRITCSDKTFTRIATEVIPEMNFLGISNVLSTCDDCRELIEKLYSFRDTCVKSNRLLTEYVNVLLSKGHEIGDIRIEINDVMKRTDSTTVTYGNTSPCGDIQTDEMETGCVDFEYLNLKDDIKIEPEQVFVDGPLLGSSEGFGSVAVTNESFMFNRDDSSASHVEELGISGSFDNGRVSESAEMEIGTVDDICGPFGYKTDGGVDVACKDLGTASDVKSQPPISLGKTLNTEDIKEETERPTSTRNTPRIPEKMEISQPILLGYIIPTNGTQVFGLVQGIPPVAPPTNPEKILYKCIPCGKTFPDSAALKTHSATHVDERPCKCQTCGKAFKSNWHLKIHNLSHSDERPHKCDDCGKAFRRIEHLRTHKTTHTGEKPYKCEICRKGFTRANYLENHILSHREVRPHECLKCKKTFTDIHRLNAHFVQHSKDNEVK